jgi:alkylation response protein AidB-like acyl-CoA dehydrogenase
MPSRRRTQPATSDHLNRGAVNFELDADQRAWRDDVRAFLRENVTPQLLAEKARHGTELPDGEVSAFRKLIGARGWFGLNWPVEYGGLGLGPIYQHILVDEFEYWGAPGPDLTVTSVAPMIMRYGTAGNREEFLPPIARGETKYAVGYSEPNAGTDLASLKTRADRDGDEWVINGSKIWNSQAQVATHEWLCVRTDHEAPKHKGISVIIVPIDHPGVEVRPLITWADYRTNETFFTDVRVPDTNLIGEINQGWRYITGALDLERGALTNAGDLRRAVDDLIGLAREERSDGRRRRGEHPDGPGSRVTTAERHHADDRGDRGQDLQQRAAPAHRRHRDEHVRPGRSPDPRRSGRTRGGQVREALPLGPVATVRGRNQRGPARRDRPARSRPAQARTLREKTTMDLTPSTEQLELGHVLRDLFTRACPTTLVREMHDSGSDGFPKGLWDALATTGVFGIALDPDYGGEGATKFDLGVVFQEGGRALCPSIVYTTLLFGIALERIGTPAQKAEHLTALSAGRLKASLAMWNPSDAHDHRPTLVATRAEDGWLLNGRLGFVQNAELADQLLVTASSTAPHEPSRTLGFLISAGRPGWTSQAQTTITRDPLSEVVLTDYLVPQASVLSGADGTGLASDDLMWIANAAVALQCMEMVGGTSAVLDQTVEYVKVREQFGRPIGSFQAVQHMVADIRIAYDAARLAATQATWWMSRGETAGRAVAIAKMQASDTYKWATLNCHQMQGGMGYVLDTDLHLWSARAKLTELLGGNADVAAGWLQSELGLVR